MVILWHEPFNVLDDHGNFDEDFLQFVISDDPLEPPQELGDALNRDSLNHRTVTTFYRQVIPDLSSNQTLIGLYWDRSNSPEFT